MPLRPIQILRRLNRRRGANQLKGHSMNLRIRLTAVAVALTSTSIAPAYADTPVGPAVEALLIEGRLADARAQLEAQLDSDAKDDDARFALGIVQTLEGGERLMQSLHRYGLDPGWMRDLPIVRLPVPVNPSPEPLTNEDFRQIIVELLADFARAEATLAAIESPDVRLPLHVGMYRLDFDDDGRADADEALWQLYARITRQDVNEQAASQFAITADRGDVHWLRGYIHLLSAMCEMFLAYDTSTLHDYTAQLFFPTAKTRFTETPNYLGPISWEAITDGIAFIHLLDCPVVEPERLKAAHSHWLAVIEQSRLSWKAILAETDDEQEWVPSPQQKNAAIPGAAISQEMVQGWHAVLDELEAVLTGEKRVPYWRGRRDVGVNVRRVFYEPTEFDLVMWFQGGAALPYLEEGEQTDPDFWRRLQTEFRGQFFWFALWVN
jgi:hypothetical protein